MTEPKSDVFVGNKVYPDAKGIFYGSFQSLEDVKQDCVVILDTNALLVPYGISKNSLAQIEATYAPLARANRLLIPGQVAREFARNRPTKIADIFQALSRKRNLSAPDRGRYPLLEEAEDYRDLQEIEKELEAIITMYRSSITKLLDHIKSWHWNDPVSRLYSRVFSDLVFDPPIDEKKLLEQMDYQQANKLPPGYKDAGKDDRGIGDHLIWNSVLSVATERKCPVVLVSGDAKADWFYRSEGQPLFPRYELVDEIRRVSDGKSLHIVPFSTFLELFGANSEAIVEVRKEEIKVDLSTMSRQDRAVVTSHLAEMAVAAWLETNYPELELERDEKYGDLAWSDVGGASILVDVKYFAVTNEPKVRSRFIHSIERMERLRENSSFPYDNVICFWVFESPADCENAIDFIHKKIVREPPRQSSVVFAVIMEGSLRVNDPFHVLPSY